MNLRKLPATVIGVIGRPFAFVLSLPWREISIDVVGLGGLGLIASGVHLNWGLGYALIAGGAPLFVWYVWREYKLARVARRA